MDLIDVVAFINLSERKDRLFWCENQLRNMPFKRIIRIDAVKSLNGHIGCAMSHIKTLKLFSSLPHEVFLILEDDFVFTRKQEDVNYYLQKLKNYSWDVFCFSFTYEKLETDFGDGIVQIQKCHSTCAYMFHKSFIPNLLDVFYEGLKTEKPIDVTWQKLQKQYIFLATKKPLVIQNISYSDIEKQVMFYQNYGSFIKVRAIGQLGNILFQIANAISLSIRYHKILFIDYDDDDNKNFKKNAKYEEYLNIPSWKSTYNDNNKEKTIQYYDIPYQEIVLDYDNSFQITGYFQSYKFFSNIFSQQLDDLFFTHKLTVTSYKTKGIILVSIHVRLGDYLKNDDVYYNLSTSHYYSRCIQWFRDRFVNYPLQFVVFSDNIKTCRQNSLFEGFLFDDKNHADVESLISMSTCDHHIVANSSFSWWGAHLNKKKNKIVLRPDRFYNSCTDKLGTQDYYPQEWIPIICSNVTMVICYIPVKKSKHSCLEYEKKWIPNLMKVQTPMVIYTTKSMEMYFQEQRRYQKNITHIIILTIEELSTYRFKKEWEALHKIDPEKHIHNTELYMIWNEKINLVYKVTNKNPFHTDYFVYIDAGYLRKLEHEMYKNWPFDETVFSNIVGKDKIFVYDIHLNNKMYISGAFFAGTRKAFHEFHRIYYQKMQNILLSKETNDNNYLFVGKDQNLYLSIVTQYPHLFTIQNRSTIASDPWFSPFWLFSTRSGSDSLSLQNSKTLEQKSKSDSLSLQSSRTLDQNSASHSLRILYCSTILPLVMMVFIVFLLLIKNNL